MVVGPPRLVCKLVLTNQICPGGSHEGLSGATRMMDEKSTRHYDHSVGQLIPSRDC